MLYSRTLFIYFIYSSLYLLIPYPYFIPLSPFPFGSLSLFSMSISAKNNFLIKILKCLLSKYYLFFFLPLSQYRVF